MYTDPTAALAFPAKQMGSVTAVKVEPARPPIAARTCLTADQIVRRALAVKPSLRPARPSAALVACCPSAAASVAGAIGAAQVGGASPEPAMGSARSFLEAAAWPSRAVRVVVATPIPHGDPRTSPHYKRVFCAPCGLWADFPL